MGKKGVALIASRKLNLKETDPKDQKQASWGRAKIGFYYMLLTQAKSTILYTTNVLKSTEKSKNLHVQKKGVALIAQRKKLKETD